ncbi:hypothetical protein Z969_10250 [Clostridium novyi A str. 4570]|uniref:DZANK-type domain-containing protein n=1 Tax=Clostridium novyi A str. 4570 TaxID=1444290 RepID=A0AA88ZLY7_CLONO|nr:zinc ribbon domain-containing protein [Clostridium novyi]KGN00012.1 hypothetical protein Z969_10250 [Clostridium novyi A str. 4570]
MKCPKCGANIQEDSDYCRKCGSKVVKKDDDVFVYLCPICKTPNPKYVTHCVKCGHWMLDTNFKSIPLSEKQYYNSLGVKNYTKKHQEESGNPVIAKILYIIFFVFFIFSSLDVKFGLCVFMAIFGIINILVPIRKLLINRRSTGVKILAVGLVLTVVCANYFDITPTTVSKPKVSMSEYKKQCKPITYDELAHNTEKYVNRNVKLTGQVIQVEERGDSVNLRVNITKGSFDIYKDTIWVNYNLKSKQHHIIEEDIINIWGIVRGRKTYRTIMGSNVTLPEVNAVYIELLN